MLSRAMTSLYVYPVEQLRQVLAGCMANSAPYIWQKEGSQRNFRLSCDQGRLMRLGTLQTQMVICCAYNCNFGCDVGGIFTSRWNATG
jgi:hypothetical protein